MKFQDIVIATKVDCVGKTGKAVSTIDGTAADDDIAAACGNDARAANSCRKASVLVPTCSAPAARAALAR
ncbi:MULTISPECIES: hypothetical protein [unclassified Pseudomonas]|uniref:hypothetical protein n=1 Tax=unclassified Pseudomonas TaxID=196821 RepID=UPI0015A257DB|nr:MULTISPECIES: hypothetical protein [unclassified Pseudomonas]NWC92606.1 hypothetical protein [Pseudomonas sp. IPO3779]